MGCFFIIFIRHFLRAPYVMKIKKVRISNYRSIKDTIELDFSNLTALVGPNNSGKSNILWCINKILGQETDPSSIFTEKDVYMQDPNRDIDVEITLTSPWNIFPTRALCLRI